MKRALVFPGQGSQFVGMGKEVYDAFNIAREVFEEVGSAISQDLAKLIFSGSIEELTSTENTQPALMAVSIAIFRVIEQQSGKAVTDLCAYTAGHSLGEYSALCASGAINLTDTAKLLKIRGNAMKAAPTGSMAALIGVDFAKAEEVAKFASSQGACEAANDNGGGQVVISGSSAAIDLAVASAGQFGIKRAIKLPVSAAFHSSLMSDAAKIMQDALQDVKINSPKVPLFANVTAGPVTDPETIRKLLVEQVTKVVRWRETVINLKSKEVSNIVEIGAGKVLSGLVKRIDPELSAISIQTPEDIENFLTLNPT